MKIAYSKKREMSNVLSLNAQIRTNKMCICTFCEQNISKKLTWKQNGSKLMVGSVKNDHFLMIFVIRADKK